MSEVNRLKTDILNLINDEILALDTHDIGIPLGSIFLPELLSGKGPVLPVRVISISNSDAQFVSHFSEAGNQPDPAAADHGSERRCDHSGPQ